jgi:hypothetical protein
MTEYQKALAQYNLGLVGKEYLEEAKRKDRLHEQARTNAGALRKRKQSLQAVPPRKPKPTPPPPAPHVFPPKDPPTPDEVTELVTQQAISDNATLNGTDPIVLTSPNDVRTLADVLEDLHYGINPAPTKVLGKPDIEIHV